MDSTVKWWILRMPNSGYRTTIKSSETVNCLLCWAQRHFGVSTHKTPTTSGAFSGERTTIALCCIQQHFLPNMRNNTIIHLRWLAVSSISFFLSLFLSFVRQNFHTGWSEQFEWMNFWKESLWPIVVLTSCRFDDAVKCFQLRFRRRSLMDFEPFAGI